MNASIQALRAITAATFQRLLFWLTISAGLVFLLLVGLTLYLGSTVSPWWFLLFALLTPLILIVTALAAAFYFLTSRLLPRKLSRDERQMIHDFTGKLMGLAEVRATPWPVMAFLIGKDVIRGKQSGFINTAIENASGLRDGFEQIRKLFERKTLQ